MVQTCAGKNVCITAYISSEALDCPSFAGLLLLFCFRESWCFGFTAIFHLKVEEVEIVFYAVVYAFLSAHVSMYKKTKQACGKSVLHSFI